MTAKKQASKKIKNVKHDGGQNGAPGEVLNDLESILADVYRVSDDVGEQVAELLADARKHPLTRDELSHLLKRVVEVVRAGAQQRKDTKTVKMLMDPEALIARISALRDSTTPYQPTGAHRRVQLQTRNGVEPTPVVPRQYFHGIHVPLIGGYVATRDIQLWPGNARLEIHVGQFAQRMGRKPTSEELLEIMLSRIPGIGRDNQFQILELARSIAVNGIRKPPIIDIDGGLLDGNRRVAAAYLILNSGDYDADQKRLVEHIYVWQLTEHATNDERDAVVVSLNFEDDQKQKWPEYVKARKIHEEWDAIIALETRPTPQRLASLKKQLSERFALGPDTAIVNRYLKMIQWVRDFEDYHVVKKGRDSFNVQHKSDQYFQYFDEIAKGAQPGGVAFALGQDEKYKEAVYDLLYDGKIESYVDIRELKYIAETPEALESFYRARDADTQAMGIRLLDEAITAEKLKRPGRREAAPNTQIETFVRFLMDLNVRTIKEQVTRENLLRLRDALRYVDRLVAAVLTEKKR